jgi:pimeloyl-ACP methyl ester carboxylesterase
MIFIILQICAKLLLFHFVVMFAFHSFNSEILLHYKTYRLSDTAEWVVFIHGAGGSSSIWFKQLREYKAQFNVLLVDLRGHGKSAENAIQKYWQQEYTFKCVANDVLEVLDALHIEKAHFVGISLGTILIRVLAEIDPQRVISMILGGAIIRLNIRSQFLMWVGNKLKQLVPYMWLYSLFAWVIMPSKRNSFSRQLFIRDAKRFLCQQEFKNWFKLTAEVNPLLRFFREKELPIPTLYLMGDEDYMFLPQVKMQVAKHAYSRLSVIPDCGHVCNVEQPDLFNQISIDFIQQLKR